ncbi:unnamed protein product, partial [Closterium sp. NIES-54]
ILAKNINKKLLAPFLPFPPFPPPFPPLFLHLPLPRSPPPSPPLYPPPSPSPFPSTFPYPLSSTFPSLFPSTFPNPRPGGGGSLHIPLSEEEAREIIQASLHIPLSEEEAREIIQAVSQGKFCPNSGVPNEDVAPTLDEPMHVHHLDLDRNGRVSVSDLDVGFQSLHIPLSEGEAREIIQTVS